MVEEIIIYGLFVSAVFFLLRKFVFKRKEKKCGTNCGCG